MSLQVNTVAKSSFHLLNCIAKTKKFLTLESTIFFIDAFITSKLGYFNTVLYDINKHDFFCYYYYYYYCNYIIIMLLLLVIKMCSKISSFEPSQKTIPLPLK